MERVLSDTQISQLLGKIGQGYIFVDLNNTLINDSTAAVTVEKSELEQCVLKARRAGFQVSLCSDSPFRPLEAWSRRFGITGPVISENGLMLNGGKLFNGGLDTVFIKQQITEWATRKKIYVWRDVVAQEFGCGTVPTVPIEADALAFGEGRVQSISVFCFQGEKYSSEITTLLQSFLQKRLNGNVSFDSFPEGGNIVIHPGDYRTNKAQALQIIGSILSSQGKSCWMIGNSISDLSHSPHCKVAMVGNASSKTKSKTDLVAKAEFTAGVIELIGRIIAGGGR